MNTLSVNVQYRPVRIGWCVRENNFDDYKKALRLTHTLWGGRFNPLIPVGNTKLAADLVELFKVDILFPISEDKIILDFIDQCPHLPWPFRFDKQLYYNWQGKNRVPVFLDLYHAESRFFSDLHEENTLSKMQLKLISWEDNDSLANIFEAMFGSLPSQEEMNVNFDYKQILTRRL